MSVDNKDIPTFLGGPGRPVKFENKDIDVNAHVVPGIRTRTIPPPEEQDPRMRYLKDSDRECAAPKTVKQIQETVSERATLYKKGSK